MRCILFSRTSVLKTRLESVVDRSNWLTKLNSSGQIQNLTSDNVSTNAKVCRILGDILQEKDGIKFDGIAQHSQ